MTSYERVAVAGVTVVLVADEGRPRVLAVTDAEGRARLAVPRGTSGTVCVRRGGRDEAPQPLAADVDTGTVVSLYVPSTLPISLVVTRRGVPSLPASFELSVSGRPVVVRAKSAEDGWVSGTFQPSSEAAPATLTISTPEAPPLTVPVVYGPSDAGIHMYLELEPAGPALVVEARVPSAVAEAIAPYIVSRLDPDTGAWKHARFAKEAPVLGDDGVWRTRVEGLAAGDYRVREGLAASLSDPVTLEPRGTDAVVRFAFPNAGRVRGRIEVGAGLDPTLAEYVLWNGPTTEGTPRLHGGAIEGRFDVPIPGDRPVTLRAIHPLGANDAPGVAVTITEPRDDVVLRVEAGMTTRVEFSLADDDPSPPQVVWVHAWDAAAGRVAWQSTARPDGAAFRFTGAASGTYDLVLDDGHHAPVVLPDVHVGPEPHHLGRHRLTYGEAIEIRVIVPDGLKRPLWIESTASRIGESRGCGLSRGGDGQRIRGLLPGRYKVSFYGGRGPLPPANGAVQTVEVVEGQPAVATIEFLRSGSPK
ncbi:MAG: hypothetical protein JNM10_05880 [Planctomycetia bacterium]|nr:hypothetical protein [Planctomycetia bacterium]